MIENGDTLDIRGDILLFFQTFILLFFAEQLMIYLNWFLNDKTGRYLVLHVFINLYVTIVHLDDVFLVLINPLPTDSRGVVVIYCLHLYHIIFFKPLHLVDWAHHIIMIVIMLPCGYLVRPGPLLGHGAFWSSGLPGMLDYMLLICVKKKWINSITEKKINSYLQLWVRQIGCIFHSLLVWITYTKITEEGGLSSSLLSGWEFDIAVTIIILTFL